MFDKFFIGTDKLLPVDRFIPKSKPPPGSKSGQSVTVVHKRWT